MIDPGVEKKAMSREEKVSNFNLARFFSFSDHFSFSFFPSFVSFPSNVHFAFLYNYFIFFLCYFVCYLPTIMASVFAAFVSIRNLRTWTLAPLSVRLPSRLPELFGECSPFIACGFSLKRLCVSGQSVELLCRSAIGSLEHDDIIDDAWLEDVVDIVGLVIWSVDGYDTDIVTLSL